MDHGTIASIALFLVACGVIGGALVGWYIRSLGWEK